MSFIVLYYQKFEEALEAYGEAISLDSTNMSFISNRAAVYFEQKDYEACIAEVSELSCRPSWFLDKYKILQARKRMIINYFVQ